MATVSKNHVWTRKSFGRSLGACSSCREKHTKCDETRPKCLKCVKYSRTCVYANGDPSKEWKRNIVTFNASEPFGKPSGKPSRKPPRASKLEPNSTSPSETCSRDVVILKKRQVELNVPRSIQAFIGDGYSIRDIHALTHFSRVTAGDLIGSQQLWTQDGIPLAFTNEFLMHAVLTTSACHLQRLNPESYQKHNIQSNTHLQHAIRSFRNALSSRTYVASNFEAVVATTFLFLMHACSNPVFDPKSRAIDALLQHSSGLYDIIRYHPCQAPFSIFQPICTPKLLPPAKPDSGPGQDLLNMAKFPDAELNTPDPNAKVYIGIIKSLAPILDIVISRPPFGGSHPDELLLYFIHWLSFLPPEFVRLVNIYDKKALIIMAHYYAVVASVLSHWKHGWWWLRYRPEYMIENIGAYVGERWGEWMTWPLSILKTCRETPNNLEHIAYDGEIHLDRSGLAEKTELGVLAAVEIHPDKMEIEGQVSSKHRQYP